MSLTEFIVTAEKKEVELTVQPSKSITVETPVTPGVIVIAAGNVGPRGPAGKWESMTQAEYELLNPPDPDTLYIIVQ